MLSRVVLLVPTRISTRKTARLIYCLRICRLSTGHMARLESIFSPRIFFGASVLTGSILLYIWVTDTSVTASNYPKTLEALTYRRLPLNALSYAMGRVGQVEIPVFLRSAILGTYVWSTGCNLADAVDSDLKSYKSFNEFFSRKLIEEKRPIDVLASLTSPADGTVMYVGPVNEFQSELYQVKGVTYSLDEFLGPIQDYRASNPATGSRHKTNLALYQCTIYLAPGDYHRFHAPADWVIKTRRHFPGNLLPVRPSLTSRLPGLFAMNERVVYLGSWKHGFMSLTAVGAVGVGSFSVGRDPTLTTNQPSKKGLLGLPSFRRPASPAYEELSLGPLEEKIGEDFGHFNLGSTIVLVFEAPEDSFNWSVKAGSRVQYGTRLISDDN